jgi:hypothetical protein
VAVRKVLVGARNHINVFEFNANLARMICYDLKQNRKRRIKYGELEIIMMACPNTGKCPFKD